MRVHRLVSAPVFGRRAAADVRRQRHFAVRFEQRPDIGVELKPKQRTVPAQHPDARTVGEAHFGPVARTAAGPDLRRRRARAGNALQQQFHLPSRGLVTAQAGANDTGVVQNKQIAGLEKTGQFRKVPIFRGIALDNQQTARRALGQRLLSDEFRRQIVVKFGTVHGAAILTQAASVNDGAILLAAARERLELAVPLRVRLSLQHMCVAWRAWRA